MSTRNQRSDSSKERFWRRMVRQWHNSGLSVRAFCQQQDLAEPTFYTWRRTIAQRDAVAHPDLPARAGDQRSEDDAHHSGRYDRDSGSRVSLRSSSASRSRLRWANPAAAGGTFGGRPAMMLSLPTSVSIWLASQPTDLRKSFDTLAEVVRHHLQSDPLSGQLLMLPSLSPFRITRFLVRLHAPFSPLLLSEWSAQPAAFHPGRRVRGPADAAIAAVPRLWPTRSSGSCPLPAADRPDTRTAAICEARSACPQIGGQHR